MESKSRENKFYLVILFVFIVAFIGIAILYLAKKNNTSIILQGEPKDVVMENFNGEMEFQSYSLYSGDAILTNESDISFDLNGKTYHAAPYELVIEFTSVPSEEGENLSLGGISNPIIQFLSSASAVDDVQADSIGLKYESRVTESDYDTSQEYNKVTTAPLEVTINNISSLPSIYVGFGDPLYANDNTVIKLGDVVLSDCGGNINLHGMGEFSFSSVSDVTISLMNPSDALYLNGHIGTISGFFSNDDAALYCTTGTSQNSFFCGNQKVYAQGKALSLEYEYNSESADLIVNGKPKVARLEGIDILEGFVQYLVSNFDSFFMALIGAILGLAIDKTLKKE
ncbi:hypothetical protein [Butyrivibrio sp. VCB2006]|uniref:hypothetical protein n=1 Tax=Butyrivibrio sp. VCB2006 TaxID=1280679 RepID=UPI000429D051|nr:hypothetical protein [Butyrivibrio sp. VCB2006]